MNLYSVDPAEPHHMPWLHGNDLAISEANGLLWTLCGEIRRVVTKPRSRPKSPLPQMREEAARILSSVTHDRSGVGNNYAAPILASLDRDTISILAGRALNPELDHNTWNEIAPHITPEILNAMMYENIDIAQIPLETIAKFNPEAASEVRRRAPDDAASVSIIRRFADAARHGIVIGAHTLEVLENFLTRHPETTWRYAHAVAVSCNDPWLVLACGRVAGRSAAEPIRLSDDEKVRRLCKLTESAHGLMHIHQAIPDPAAFLENPDAAIAALSGSSPS